MGKQNNHHIMETLIIQDCIISEEDRKFSLLPDGREVTFSSLSGLKNYVQDEIAAWTNVENSIAKKYQVISSKIDALSKEAQNGELVAGSLKVIKKIMSEWTIRDHGINSCIDSRSHLGRYIKELRDQYPTDSMFHDCCFVTFRFLGYPYPSSCMTHSLSQFQLIIVVARAAKYFACPEDISSRVDEYRKQLMGLTDAANAQKSDYEFRMGQFDRYEDEFKQKRDLELAKEEAEYAERLNKADEKIQALENAYSKKLQLEGPSRYWKDLAQSYLHRGWVLLFMTLIIGICIMAWLFNILLDGDTLSLFNQTTINLATIRGSLILLVVTSIAGYLLHLFTKLAISCFHLSRDYRERFQLTNVFLALLHDGDVKCDDSVKQIVMQALFSRSDTGLLKGEHSFTMPGVADLLKSNDV